MFGYREVEVVEVPTPVVGELAKLIHQARAFHAGLDRCGSFAMRLLWLELRVRSELLCKVLEAAWIALMGDIALPTELDDAAIDRLEEAFKQRIRTTCNEGALQPGQLVGLYCRIAMTHLILAQGEMDDMFPQLKAYMKTLD